MRSGVISARELWPAAAHALHMGAMPRRWVFTVPGSRGLRRGGIVALPLSITSCQSFTWLSIGSGRSSV